MGGTIDRMMQGGGTSTAPSANPIDSIMGRQPSIDELMGGRKGFDPYALAPRQVGPENFPAEPGILSKVLEILKEQGQSLVQFGKYTLTGGYGWNPTIPIPDQRSGMARDILAASQGDLEAEKRINRGNEGAALAASTIAASGLGSVFGAAAKGAGGGALRRAAAFLAAESLGGATYGAIAPLEDGQSREEAIKEDMIAFPIAGAALHGIFKGAGKLFKGFFNLAPEVASTLKDMGKKDADDVAKRTLEILNEVGDIPPRAEAQIQSEALASATKEVQARKVTATARMVGSKVESAEPDFTVEINEPPPRSTNPIGTDLSQAVAESEAKRQSGLKRNLATVSEEELQNELNAITPKPAVVDEEAAALARVEAARNTPLPEVDPVKNLEKLQPGKQLRVKLSDPETPRDVTLHKNVDGTVRVALRTFYPRGDAGPGGWRETGGPFKMSVEDARNYVNTQLGITPDIPQGITPEPLQESAVRNPDGTLKRVYHGTNKVYDEVDPTKLDPDALYGPGIYTTDNPEVAFGYAVPTSTRTAIDSNEFLVRNAQKNIARIDEELAKHNVLGAEQARLMRERDRWVSELRQGEAGLDVMNRTIGNPNTRPAYLDIKKPFDIDAQYTPEQAKQIFDAGGIKKAEPFYNGSRSTWKGEDIIDQFVAEGSKAKIPEALRASGFDGITHVGGKITGGNKHQVYIAFSSDQVHTPWSIEVQKQLAELARNQNPITENALADAIADAAVAETKPTEIMDEVTQTEAMEAFKELKSLGSLPVDDMDTSVIESTPKALTGGLGAKVIGTPVFDAISGAVRDGLIPEELGLTLKRALAFNGDPKNPISKVLRKLAGERMSNAEWAKRMGYEGAISKYNIVADDLLDLAKIAEGFEKGESNPLGSMGTTADPGAGQFKQSWSSMNEEQLNALKSLLMRFLKSDAGAISGRAAARLGAASLSGAAFYQAEQEDDPRARALLNAVGGVLAWGALVPGKATQQWLKETPFTYAIIKAFDLPRIASSGTKESMHAWQAATQQGRAFAKQLENRLRPVFPDDLSKKAAMYSLDEGPTAPEWATLTPDQQREVVSQSILNNSMGRILASLGIIPNARMHYVRHLFQDQGMQALWYSAWEALGKAGQFAKQRQFETLREAEAWAAKNGKKGPVMDPAVAQSFHMIEVTKAIANKKIQQAFERLGMLQDFDHNIVASQPSTVRPGDRLRQVRIKNLGREKMAPDDAATVLERAAAGAGQWGLGKEYIDSLDKARGLLMRGIMFWAWEHGINVMRGAAALDGTGTAFREGLIKLRNADPLVMEVSKYADLFQRPDFGPEHQTAFDRMLAKIGASSPTLKKLGIGFEDFRARGERKLWDEHVPALGMAAWSQYMLNWTKRTGGRHLIGSPEYEAAAKEAGKFANNAMGKVPGLVQAPQVATLLRQILFSPNWTRGRIAITAHAAGELSKIAAGEINPREATYLGYKLRSILVGATLTAIGSYLLTQKWPKFNPNTQKFYMNTGVKDHNGREVGVDLTGWWQDDLKLFNEPFNYIRDRQNPMLREFTEQVSGRDLFGRSIQNMDRLESLIQAVGPIGEAITGGAEFAGAAIRGEGFDPAAAIRAASGVAAVGNVSSLPREADALVAKMAGKILRQSGLPDDKDRIYELSQRMRKSYSQTGSLYDGEVNSWIASQRRAQRKKPLTWLWQEGKAALRDLAK